MVPRLEVRHARCMTRTTNLGTAHEIADAVRSGRSTAAEVTRAHLARIDRLDGALGRSGRCVTPRWPRRRRSMPVSTAVSCHWPEFRSRSRTTSQWWASRSDMDLTQPRPIRRLPMTNWWFGCGGPAPWSSGSPGCRSWRPGRSRLSPDVLRRRQVGAVLPGLEPCRASRAVGAGGPARRPAPCCPAHRRLGLGADAPRRRRTDRGGAPTCVAVTPEFRQVRPGPTFIHERKASR